MFWKFNEWRCSVSSTFKCWCMFLEAAELQLNSRAEPEGYRTSVFTPQPRWCHTFLWLTKNNFSRWTPLYLLNMLQLPNYVQEAFRRGNFSVRRAPGKFNGIWNDMGTETTVIWDSMGDSGIMGLTQKQPALVRRSGTRRIHGYYASHMWNRNWQTVKHSEIHEQAQSASMSKILLTT